MLSKLVKSIIFLSLMIVCLQFPVSMGIVTTVNAFDGLETTYNGRRYRVFEENMNWFEARDYCEQIGGHLATFSSADEFNAVKKIIAAGKMNQYWIGLFRSAPSADFEWVTGESYSFADWDNGMPDCQDRYDGECELYVQVLNKPNPNVDGSRQYKWNDIFYDNYYPGESYYFSIDFIGFICEWETSSDPDPAPSPYEAKAPYYTTGQFSFLSDINGGMESLHYSFQYDENWFFRSTNRYNHSLALMSLKMAMASMSDSSTTFNKNIIDFYKRLEFPDRMTRKHYPAAEENSVGYVIGAKNIKSGKNTISLIAVTIRSGGYRKEWAGNFNVGKSRLHSGFDKGANDVRDALEGFIQKHYDDLAGEIKVWISGYSRGAAIGNLLAAKLDDGEISGISNDDVFAYCFECPQNVRKLNDWDTSQNPHNAEYNNIFNIVNPIDLVPKVAPSYHNWKYTRYGITKAIYSTSNIRYIIDLKAKMKQCYKDILVFNGERYSEYLESLTNEKLGQANQLNSLVDYLSLKTFGPEYFTDHLQRDVQDIVVKYLAEEENDPDLAGFIENLFYSLNLSMEYQYLNYQLRGIPIPPELKMYFAVKKEQTEFNSALVSALNLFLFADDAPVAKAHYSELCLAWMESLRSDSGWQGENTQTSKLSSFNLTADDDSTLDEEVIFAPTTNRILYVSTSGDISVFDSQGILAAQVIEGDSQEIEDGIYTAVNYNNERFFVLPDDDQFRVEITANTDEVITYTCVEQDYIENENQKVVSYLEVNTKAGDKLVGTVENISDDIDAGEYKLSQNDKELMPDEVIWDQSQTTFEVNVSVDGAGTVNGGGEFAFGQQALLNVIEGEDDFVGWFDESGNCLSTDVVYGFNVIEDTNITAVFKTSGPVSFVLNKESTEMKAGETETLTVSSEPVDANKSVTWISSNEKIATVDQNGTVKGIKPGYATITATASNGLKASCEVRVLFTDIPAEGKYYSIPVYWAVENGITNGYTDSDGIIRTFKPQNNCTREAVVTFLWRLAGKPEPTNLNSSFSDVQDKGKYYYKAVLWAAELGITKGYQDGTFRPNATCLREHVVTFLYRYAGKPIPKTTKNPFNDVTTSDYYYKATLWANENKIANGYSTGEYAGGFGPKLDCLREHVATFLYRFAK